MKQKHFIDAHKGLTGPVILAMIAWHGQWQSPTAWVYLGLHGTYGVLWVLKSRLFPDRSWEESTGLAYGLTIWAGMTLYWIAPWIITLYGVQAPPWYMALCVALWGGGVFLHFAADMQKHTALRRTPGELITDGLFSRCRNPNYFGELLIYLAFALLSMHWLPLAALVLMVGAVWIPNMRRKDRSLARYPEFEAYRRRSAFFIPGLL